MLNALKSLQNTFARQSKIDYFKNLPFKFDLIDEVFQF